MPTTAMPVLPVLVRADQAIGICNPINGRWGGLVDTFLNGQADDPVTDPSG
jgi:hypothetical protein